MSAEALAMMASSLGLQLPPHTARMPGAPPTSAPPPSEAQNTEDSKESKDADADAEDHAAEDVSYKAYEPRKLKFGKPHPDPVVENATLSAVEPPDIRYNLAIPADVIHNGMLSNLQLEAVVYGSQRHLIDLPIRKKPEPENDVENMGNVVTPTRSTKSPVDSKNSSSNTHGRKRKSPQPNEEGGDEIPCRAGFMLGDGAGMGKGRTLAAFCYENIVRGRNKHIWISVSSDLYGKKKF